MLFVLALLVFWLVLKRVVQAISPEGAGRRFSSHGYFGLALLLAAGIILGLTFYTYIPARALWIVYPLLLVYWLFKRREFAREMWWRIGAMLLTMFTVASPLLLYLRANPQAELRIRQLAGPLYAAQEGNWRIIAGQSLASLKLFFVQGDPTWRYNIGGRPFLDPLFGILFMLGLAQALWWLASGKETADRLLGSASFLSLSWLVAGFTPALVTGPALSMTQAIAVQPLVYLFPAIALATTAALVSRRVARGPRMLLTAGIILLYVAMAVTTWRDYFQTWANHPEVRVQYETTLATAVDYLNANGRGEVALSTITPGRYHSPALAAMTLKNEDVTLRWFDGRGSLLLPRSESATVVLPGFTPLPAALARYFDTAELVDTLPMRESDRDRPLRFYRVDRPTMLADWRRRLTPAEARFGETLDLGGFELLPAAARPGDQVAVVTFWQTRQPLEEVVLFTHVMGPDGVPIAQADRLDVPGYSWMAGDSFLQLHQFNLPEDLAPGEYQVAVGAYTYPDGERLELAGAEQGSGLFSLAPLTVLP
jgi:hypothetical protein